MIAISLTVQRHWPERPDDLHALDVMHRERATVLRALATNHHLDVRDWGETFGDHASEWVTVEIAALDDEQLRTIVNEAALWVVYGEVRDVRVAHEPGEEYSVRERLADGSLRPTESRGRGIGFGNVIDDTDTGGPIDDTDAGGPGLGAGPDDFEAVPGDDGEPAVAEEPLAANGHGADPAFDIEPAIPNGDDHPPAMASGDEPPMRNGGDHAPALRRPRERRVVSTGFAEPGQPSKPLTGNEPLSPSRDYLYWLEVGATPVKGSIEEKHVELIPEETLEDGAEFVVALFGFPKELAIDEEHSTGLLRYTAGGRFSVARQPTGDRFAAERDAAGYERRMLFPVATPKQVGKARLRCNIYFRGVLVQSRVVTAYVGEVPEKGRARLAHVDFQLAHLDAPRELAPIQPHALSIQLNSNGVASHSFRFAGFADGEPEFKSDAVLPATELQDLITQSRGVMRAVAWGSTSEWSKGTEFRYTAVPFPDVQDDLLALMRKGRQLYDTVINELAGGPDAALELQKRMLAPGRVQVVNTGSPADLIPTSLVYDYTNTEPALGDLKLCPEFVSARGRPEPLEESACFKGACPSIAEPQVVCPSGFWGYRHAIGIPVRSKWGPAPPVRMTFNESPSLGIAYFPGFDLVDSHRQHIAAQDPGWQLLEPADSFVDALAMLNARPHVVYFYCHGGLSTGNAPYLLVGTDEKQPLFSASLRPTDATLDRYRLPRSLVILNGCESNAVEPDRAMKLVSAFVDNVAAAGVIGTEITISEELAVAFGEALLRNIRGSIEVGESVRRARLALLKEGNPLGLVYLPMVASDLVLAQQPVN